VVQILGVSASMDGVNVAMIMEYCDGGKKKTIKRGIKCILMIKFIGSLDKAIAKKSVTFEMKIHYLSGIAKGMYHLHKNKIVHRDLAARNILVRKYEYYENKLIKMIIQLSRGNEAKISVSYLNFDIKRHNVNITPIGLWNVEKNDRSSRSWHH
jgi:serine/threonine protein kinase